MLNDKEYVSLCYKIRKEFQKESQEYKEALEKMIEYNKYLVNEYPFLLPRNVWTDKVLLDYDYSFTELDALPNGWRIAFGIQMMDEIKDALIRNNYLDEFRIMQIKEKYGGLRFYVNSAPAEVFDIINKYEKKSFEVCQKCGKPVKYQSAGWIGFFCEDCAKEVGLEYFVLLEERED